MKKSSVSFEKETLTIKTIMVCLEKPWLLFLPLGIICLLGALLFGPDSSSQKSEPSIEAPVVSLNWQLGMVRKGDSIWTLCDQVTPSRNQLLQCVRDFYEINRESFTRPTHHEKAFELIAEAELFMPKK